MKYYKDIMILVNGCPRSVSDSLEAFKKRIQRLGLRPRRGPPVHSRASNKACDAGYDPSVA